MAEGIPGLVDHLRTAARLARGRVRSDWQYRTSFLLLMGSQAAVAITEVMAILIVVDVAPSLGGWTPNQILALYGLVFTAFGLADVVASAAGSVAGYVRSGEFDRVLLRPTPSLLQFLALEFQLRRLGKAIPPMVTLGVALSRSGLTWSPWSVALVVLSVTAGTAIFSALFIAAAALNFWIIDSSQATNAATYGSSTAAQYPLHLYPRAMRIGLGWLIPVAFVGYLPAIALFDAANPLNLPVGLAYAGLPVGVIALAASIWLWQAGVDHYQSTGS